MPLNAETRPSLRRSPFAVVPLLCAALCCSGCTTIPTPMGSELQARADAIARERHWDGGRRFEHVVIVVLENGSYDQAVADSVLRRWARMGAPLTNVHALF